MTKKVKTSILHQGVLPNGQEIEAKMTVYGEWYSGCLGTLECPAEDPEVTYLRVEAVNFPQEYAETMLEAWEAINGIIDGEADVEWDFC
jgi:hypothetical protein